MAKGKGGFLGQDGLNAPDQATGVSATAGNTQATVSWTAPSDVGGSAITGYNVQASDGTRAFTSFSYTSKTASVASQDTTPEGVFFKTDGTKMYMVGSATDAVYQYSLSTAWDVSSASYDSVSLSVSSQDTIPSDLYFKPDGTALYVMGRSNDTVFQYTLSTAWDLSTASYASKSFSVTSQAGSPTGIYLKSDGTKMYVIGFTADAVFQYSLSIAWDVSSASYDSVSLDVSSEGVNPQGLGFSTDGTRLFVAEVSTGDFVSGYGLSTAWDLSTASYTGELLSYAAEDGYGSGFYYKDAQTAYVLGRDSDAVFQYGADEYPTSSPVTVTGLTNGTSYTFNVWAINASGWSAPSEASDSITPFAPLGYFLGGTNGSTAVNDISYINITTTGMDSIDFGNLSVTQKEGSGCSSDTRGLIGGGLDNSNNTLNTIQKITLSTSGSGSDFGDLTVGRYGVGGLSNQTRGIWFGGFASGSRYNVIDYVTIATTGNATDFGNMLSATNAVQGCSSTTRGLMAGGNTGSRINVIQYITIASTSNATDFGNLTAAKSGVAGASSNTRGLFANGYTGSNINNIDYVTIASTGNAADFGDASEAAQYKAGTSNKTIGVFAAGFSSSGNNTIDRVTIATTGNAVEFGDLTGTQQQTVSACSNSHGGL